VQERLLKAASAQEALELFAQQQPLAETVELKRAA
jgi:hypothetical protein